MKALISVSDKNGIKPLAEALYKLGYEIISTSNTARLLRESIPVVREISELTGFEEILDGRVKTLHPVIHGGILADRSVPEHVRTLEKHQIAPIDIVAVNLYPFARTRAEKDATHQMIIENIDIGGPTLIRAAAKNYAHVIVLTDPSDYQPTLQMLESVQGVSLKWRQYLAAKAFKLIREYDECIEGYFASLQEDSSKELKIRAALHARLRYGENPHQQAGFYSCQDQPWKVLHGMEMSYNNILDLDSSLRVLRLFEEPTAVIVKHTNPCGIGSAPKLADAYSKAFAADTDSPFGGIVSVNRILDWETARRINEIFTEIIIAPGFEAAAWDLLIKKKNRRLIQYEPSALQTRGSTMDIRSTLWGWLVQDWDEVNDPVESFRVVTQRQPSAQELAAMSWGWRVVSVLKSNAIALCTSSQVLGLGFGQPSRIDSTRIAIQKALKYLHDPAAGICASDGFFPYADSAQLLHSAGVRAIIQPGGSKGDEDVIRACDELGMSMVFTGVRHFRH